MRCSTEGGEKLGEQRRGRGSRLLVDWMEAGGERERCQEWLSGFHLWGLVVLFSELET